MNEMNNLSKEIAVELNEEVTNLEVEQPAEELVMQEDLAAAAVPCSAASTISRDVPFCCSTTLPPTFGVDTPNPKILFTLGSLRVVIEPCTTTVTIPGIGSTCPFTAWNVRIVGCIPFLLNAPAGPEAAARCIKPASATGDTFFVCCSGNACVDNIVCRTCNEADALAAQAIVQAKLADCNCVNATINVIRSGIGTPNRCAVTFTGTFTLPNCNSRVGTNCNP